MKKLFKYLLIIMFCVLSIPSFDAVDLNAASPEDYDHWFTEKDPVTDYAYSFAFIGDTQSLSFYNKKHMHTLYQWIVDNKKEKNIQYVFGLGDITEGDLDWEWDNNKAAISLMDGVVPYSLIRGNHDTTAKFYNTFGNDTYMSQFSGFYKEENLNSSYRTLKVGKMDFLLLTLDYGADDEELVWAGNIIERYPNHKVIISTHAYMNKDGTTLDSNDPVVPTKQNDDDKSDKEYNSGEDIWNKLVSQYGNIVLVLSGHIDTDELPTLQSKGIHGNTVTQMLIDPQTMDKDLRGPEGEEGDKLKENDPSIDQGVGMICMAYFDENFTKMEIEYFSPIKNAYYKESNQFTIDISGWGDTAHNLIAKNNDYFHWQECDKCGRKLVEELEEHTFAYDCSSTCDSCNFTRKNVVHNFTKYSSNADGHFKVCATCGEVDASSSLKPHIYDNSCDNSCNMCGYQRSATHGELTSFNDVYSHWQECNLCHGEVNKTPHTYDNECDSICNHCGYERYTYHDYSLLIENENKLWKECSICGDKKEVNTSNSFANSTLIYIIIGVAILGITGLSIFFVIKKKRS